MANKCFQSIPLVRIYLHIAISSVSTSEIIGPHDRNIKQLTNTRTSRAAQTSELKYYNNKEICITYFVQKMLLSWVWMMRTDRMILILLMMSRLPAIGPWYVRQSLPSCHSSANSFAA